MGFMDILESRLDPAKTVRFIIAVVSVGLVLRVFGGLVLNYGYDVHHWAQVMATISSGNGLYGLTGYFYTPVWGYILGFLNLVQQSCLAFGETVYRIPEVLGFEDYAGYISANTTSLEYTFWIKLPLYIVDLVVSAVLYLVVLEFTGDRTKAIIGFMLWFLNPIVVLSPVVQGMFDNIVALLTLLCILGIHRRLYTMAGAMIGLAVLLKLFPMFLLPLLVAYLISKEGRSLRKAMPSLVRAVFGALLVTAIVFFPQFMDGTLEYCFTFLTARTNSDGDPLMQVIGLGIVAIYLLILVGSFALAVFFYRVAGRDLERDFIRFLLINVTMLFLYPPTPQYVVVLVPILVLFILSTDRTFMKPLVFITVGSAIFFLSNDFTLLLTLAHDTPFISLSTVTDLSNTVQSLRPWIYNLGGAVQYLGILYLAYRLCVEYLIPLCKRKNIGKDENFY